MRKSMPYFFLKQGKRFATSLIKEGIFRGLASHALEKSQGQIHNVHSRGIILQISLALARLHRLTSSLIFKISMLAVEDLFVKRHAFLSFHISQFTSIAREAIAFLVWPLF
jgi:flagellar biosynthesis protein FlhB